MTAAALFEASCVDVLGSAPRTFVSPAAADADDIRGVAASDRCREAGAALAADRRELVLGGRRRRGLDGLAGCPRGTLRHVVVS